MWLSISAPAVRGEIQPYFSPVDGKLIDSRAKRREDLIANGAREWDSGMKEEQIRRMAQEESRLEASVEATIDASIAALPARSREHLAAEMEHGVDATIERSTL